MRLVRVAIAAALLIFIAAVAFGLGRTTADDSQREEPAETGGRDITGGVGDVYRVPSIALFCAIDVEVNQPRMLCNRTGTRPRYQVLLERDRTVIVRIGDPGDQRVYPER